MQNKGNIILEEYVSKTIGIAFRHKKLSDNLTKVLPQYLKGTFRFSYVEIEEQDFLLLILPDEIDLPVSQIIKFAVQIRRQTGKQTLIQFWSMDSLRRRTLISNKENFVVLNKQIYLPSLRIYLNEGNSLLQLSKKEKLSPSNATFIILEIWKYNPAILADGKFIDKLSLALCYKDMGDERVHKEINKMIDNIVWLGYIE